ncbi:MAG: RnfABCDGE type electron transport complex subunit B [Verrucomicrobia bacterium]|nr:RnfABCDGE type electron transport complex subunit B [Verrucomicrobiota bacterium]MCH8514392.1 RnfABCDGE type electron transport complex subunit B [Kiritimatiellia bacterium]
MLAVILYAVLFMLGLGVVLGAILALASKKLSVREDPRIDEVEEMLPHANCGACGFPGCRPFAEAVVKGEAPPSKCSVNTADGTAAIARYLGVDAGSTEKRVARLACQGGSNVARFKAAYTGEPTCRAAVAAGGGGKACSWGCLGLADCMKSCTFDAIHMDEHDLPVVDVDKCVACNDCVVACPLDLFSLQPISRKLWVACKSLAEGDEALSECEVACTACARCALDAAPGLISMKNNLPVVDYGKNHLASKIAIERCPTGAIVWLEGGKVIKGAAAKKIIRNEPLPILPDES